MKKFLICLLTSVALFAEGDFVVCIHGFMGGKWCMNFLEKNLKQDNWNVVNWGYPSRDDLIENHGKMLVKEVLALSKKRPGKPIHFVAHSMGSLVLLAALNHPDAPIEAKIGRVVLIAPPLQGSKWARWVSQFAIIRSILKKFAGKELSTETDYFNFLGKYPDSLDKIMIIAGSLGFNPLLNGENDGTVAVSETILNAPHEHVIVKSGHKTIVFSKKVSRLTRAFLLSSPINTPLAEPNLPLVSNLASATLLFACITRLDDATLVITGTIILQHLSLNTFFKELNAIC